MPPRPPTDVCLTVDVEFSIAGTFHDPDRRRPVGAPAVECSIDGEGHGLDFLLRTLARHGQRATFFVETLCTSHFGDEPMRTYAERILVAGHEVGLHLHPCWQIFHFPDWQSRVRRAGPGDSLCGRPAEAVEATIANGLGVMQRWGLPRPTSLRMGNLMCDLGIYRAMKRLGLAVASNVGLGIHRSKDAALHLSSGAHGVEGVTELPVLTYDVGLPLGRPPRQKCLTITGTAAGITRRLLQDVRAADGGPVVVLTHPFEFAKRRDPDFATLRPNRINQRRLADLCAFVAERPADFRMTTVTEAAAAARLAVSAAAGPDVAFASVLPGLIANRLNDLVWRL